MKLACPAGLYQLDDILESRRPVKATPKGFTNQHAERCMVPTVASMDLYEQLITLLPGNAPVIAITWLNQKVGCEQDRPKR
jgi:hypothetical protein